MSQQTVRLTCMSTCGSKRHSSLPVAASNAYARPATPLVYITPSMTTGVASSTRFVPRSALQARPSASTFAAVMSASCEWCDLPGSPPVVGQSSALGREAASAREAEPDGAGRAGAEQERKRGDRQPHRPSQGLGMWYGTVMKLASIWQITPLSILKSSAR